jgi:hypothetical protein
MAKLENRKMFANFPGFDKIVSNVSDLYSGIGTLPQRSTLDIAGQFIAQNPQAFSGTAAPGTKLPSGAAILAQDVKNLFGGISAGRQTDELLRSQMESEKQAKVLDTSLDIYKESLDADQTDEKKTETEGFIDKINSYNKRIQAGETLENWELQDLENLTQIVAQKGTGRYDVKDYIEFRDKKVADADKAKNTTVLLEQAMETLADPEMTTNPVAASLSGLVKVGDAFGFDIDGFFNSVGLDRITVSGADSDTLNIINRRLALDLAEALTGNKSNFELEQLLASTPNLAADPEANSKILNILKFYADRTIAYGKFANQANSRADYNKLVEEWDSENSGPFSATSEYQQFKSGDDAFAGMNLDADEGSYVIEGQSN